MTGLAGGDHLHFTMLVNGEPVTPGGLVEQAVDGGPRAAQAPRGGRARRRQADPSAGPVRAPTGATKAMTVRNARRMNRRVRDHQTVKTGVAAVPAANVRLGDFVAITKPRLNFLVVATAAAGYYLGAGHDASWLAGLDAVGGTALVAGGASAMNQIYERETDRLMERTRLRPMPDGRLGAARGRRVRAGAVARRPARARASAPTRWRRWWRWPRSLTYVAASTRR